MAFSAPRTFGGLIGLDPFRDVAFFDRPLASRAGALPAEFVPQIDAVEDDKEFRVTAEIPGVSEDGLSVEIEDGVLTLKGEKKSYYDSASEEGAEAASSESSPRFHRVETSYGRFERRLRFNSEVDEENVQASYANGVLTVVVPKVVPVAPAVRQIPVQTN